MSHTDLLQLSMLIQQSGFFNSDYYCKQVKLKDIDYIRHYLTTGYQYGLAPSKQFSTYHYLTRYPDVAVREINPLIHYLAYGQYDNRVVDWDGQLLPKEVYTTLTYEKELSQQQDETAYNRIAVFAAHSQDMTIQNYVRSYLEALREIADYIVFIADCYYNYFAINTINDLIDYCHCSYHQKDLFGSYQIGVQWLTEKNLLANCEELILCNDCCYEPVVSLSHIWEQMSDPQYDVWSLNHADVHDEHLQSAFVVLRKKVFTDKTFVEFFANMQQENDLPDTIRNYEIYLTDYLLEHNFRYTTLTALQEYPHSYPILLTKQALLQTNCRSLSALKELNAGLYYLICDDLQPLLERKQQISFSFILATYNRRRIIGSAINSVLAQTEDNYELIIIDDGSTDGTDELIFKEYKSLLQTQKIKYYKYNTNCGVCTARNQGLRLATKQYIAYIDSDNEIQPNYLAFFIDAILEHPEQKIFYCQMTKYPENKIVGQPFDYQKLLKGNFIDLGTFVHHKNLYKELGGFDLKLKRFVDYELILRYTQKYQPYYIPCSLLRYNNDLSDQSRITLSEKAGLFLRYIRHKYTGVKKICTILTAFNNEDTIEQALKSALIQTGDFAHEILVSDDGSEDATPEIIRIYTNLYPTLITNISSKKHLGRIANLKKCIQIAKADYLTFLQAQDYFISPMKNFKQMQFLQKHSSYSMCFSGCFTLEYANLEIQEPNRQKKLNNELTYEDLITIDNPQISLSAGCYCTKFLKNLPEILYNEEFSEYTLALYLQNFGPIGFLSEKQLICRCDRDPFWTIGKEKQYLQSQILFCQNALNFIRNDFADLFQKKINKYLIKLKAVDYFDDEESAPFKITYICNENGSQDS